MFKLNQTKQNFGQHILTISQDYAQGVEDAVIPEGKEEFLIDIIIWIAEACGADLSAIKVCPIYLSACIEGFVKCGIFMLQQALDISPVGKLLEDLGQKSQKIF